MPGHRLVIVGDAHLGAAPSAVEETLLHFFEAVPSLGDSLLITGDLFDFWFAYRRAIPRRGFRVASALARLSSRIPVLMIGGNHDRWGDSFWEEECGITFSGEALQFPFGDQRAEARHGDGVMELRLAGRLMHRVTRHPATSAVFRALPPDLGMWLVDRMSGQLAETTKSAAALDRAAEAQREWAEARLRADPGLALLVMGHTHRAAASEPSPGQWYVNPGAWLDGHRYAVATRAGVELAHFS